MDKEEGHTHTSLHKVHHGQREEGCAGETVGAAASRVEEAVFGRRQTALQSGRIGRMYGSRLLE